MKANSALGALKGVHVEAAAAPMLMMAKSARLQEVSVENDAIDEEAKPAVEEVQSVEKPEDIHMRSDFAETAFFMPAVNTDKNGVATLTFTLPESVTTWRFMGLAHDEQMRNGTITSEAVAQKELMVQPNMPRFLREGDKAMITSQVSNISAEPKKVKVQMGIYDITGKTCLLSRNTQLTIPVGQSSAATFDIASERSPEGDYI